MKRISQWLTENPVLTISLFVVSIISGLMTIVTSWSTFKLILLTMVEIPGWLIILLVFCVVWFMSRREDMSKATKNIPSEFELVEGKKFGVQKVVLDGKRFVNCTFDGSELVILGSNGFALEHNTMIDTRFTFDEAAGTTLFLLEVLYKDPDFRPVIDQTFKNIASGCVKRSI